MSQSGKLTPNLDPETTKQINLSVLQRYDQHIEGILFTAAHVSLYEFDIGSHQWGRKNVEGPLFVVKRNKLPRFQFIVMNRLHTDNWVENLLDDFEFEIQRPYLLSRNAAQEVNGIWFFNSNECEEVGNLLSRILSVYSKFPQNEIPVVAPIESKYTERPALPIMSQMRGGVENPSAVSDMTQTSQNNLMDLFNAAINKGRNTPMVTNHRYHPHNPSGTTTFPTSFESPSVTYDDVGSLQTSFIQTTNHEISNLRPNAIPKTELIKPSSFYAMPQSSDSSTLPSYMPPLPPAVTVTAPQSPRNLQHSRSIKIHDLFTPTSFPRSLTPPLASPTGYGFSRDKVRDALLTLIRDDRFIEMFCQALGKPN